MNACEQFIDIFTCLRLSGYVVKLVFKNDTIFGLTIVLLKVRSNKNLKVRNQAILKRECLHK